MTMMPPVNLRPVPAKSAPKFGFIAAPMLLKALDYGSLGVSTVSQNKLIYALIISSRIAKARSTNERLENVRRDSLGWYSWFMGNPLLQVAMVMGLAPIFVKGSKEILLNKLNPKGNIFQKFLWTMFSPAKLWLIASDKVIEQRMVQIMDHYKGAGKPALARTAEKLFKTTRNFRGGVVSFYGLVFTIAMLGIGLPYLNIVLTRRALSKAKKQQSPAMPNALPPELLRALMQQATAPTSAPRSANPFNRFL